MSEPITVEKAVKLFNDPVRFRRRSDWRLVIPYDPGHASIGGTPSLPVIDLYAGFDWDNGKVFLRTEKRLGIAGDDLEALRKKTNKVYESLALIGMTLKDKRLDQASKLREVRSVVNALHRSLGIAEVA